MYVTCTQNVHFPTTNQRGLSPAPVRCCGPSVDCAVRQAAGGGCTQGGYLSATSEKELATSPISVVKSPFVKRKRHFLM